MRATHRINDRANHYKAPVRREDDLECLTRQLDQIPTSDFARELVRMSEAGKDVNVTVNADLIPGKAKFVETPSR
jgi:hypothetical protein